MNHRCSNKFKIGLVAEPPPLKDPERIGNVDPDPFVGW